MYAVCFVFALARRIFVNPDTKHTINFNWPYNYLQALQRMRYLRDRRVFEDCKEGNVWKVKNFVECGGDPRIEDDQGHSLLYTAILAQSPQIVRYLVSKGASVDYTEMQTAINNSAIDNEEDFLVPSHTHHVL